ncbi:hypothetical protein CEXT_619191 [Caerostris extrusa]|uniref:Uncharacterized protein n=1 Tax=Caerostris extrusa TaxID=172846 RepID=A0AAV4S8N9_CAEEX|nr:hypothetical protein CEXT_619191 [Caerostris extrusa]
MDTIEGLIYVQGRCITTHHIFSYGMTVTLFDLIIAMTNTLTSILFWGLKLSCHTTDVRGKDLPVRILSISLVKMYVCLDCQTITM